MDLEGGEEVNQDDLLSSGRPRACAAELAIQVFRGCETLVPVCAVGSTGETTAAIGLRVKRRVLSRNCATTLWQHHAIVTSTP